MPRLGIVYSLGDPAGSGAAALLRGIVGGSRCPSTGGAVECWLLEDIDAVLAGFREDVLYFDFLDRVEALRGVEAYIVLSRHSSASGEPTLSIHHPGNPGPSAEHGGRPWELAVAYPGLAKTLLLEYRRAAEEHGLLEAYSLTLEATHHGPTSLSKPVVFIEIGSREEQWRDRRAQEAMAQAVAEAARKGPAECVASVGLGDTHYPRIHTRLMLETDTCYGHVLARYTFQWLSAELLEQAVRKSVEPVRRIVMQKVPSRVRRLAEEVAARLGLEAVKA